MSTRNRPIRYKIAYVLLLPLLSALALSALAVGHAFTRIPVFVDILGGVVGVAAAACSVPIAARVTGRMAREARELTAGVYDFSNRRLPAMAERVRKGVETDDGDFDAPDYRFTTREVKRLNDAFVVAQNAAVKATVDEGMLRKGVGDVFVNLARRSQALVHRQLSLLDTMERRATDPEELDDLFRLDHLATRMRRHAEGLVILSGAPPSRGWRNPVPFIDVVRGAVAEVEDYPRVTVAPISGASLSGRAVADVIHLLAELIENATAFSPPHTSVQVSGQLVANGFAIEIDDRGLGLDPDRLAAINNLLANPPEFDLSDSARLGLFVVGQLAKRHDIRVSLRPSPYGGTTAIVLVPPALVADGAGEPAADAIAGTAPEHASNAGTQHVSSAAPAQTSSAAPQQIPEPASWQATAGARTAAVAGEPSVSPPGEPSRDEAAPLGPVGVPEPSAVAAPASPGRATAREPSDTAREPSGSSGSETRPASRRPGRHAASGPIDRGAAERADLPRRVRQANLAPELRAAPSPVDDPDHPPPRERSPEDVRTTMAALQTGWLRGRSESEQAEKSAGQDPTARPAPGEDAR